MYKKRYPPEYYSNSNKIYYLSCDGIPFYIGVTTMPLIKRLCDSRKDSKKDTSPKDILIRNALSANKIIEIHLIEEVSNPDHSLFLEEFWIQMFRTWGFELKNKYKVNPPKRLQSRDIVRYKQAGIGVRLNTPRLSH